MELSNVSDHDEICSCIAEVEDLFKHNFIYIHVRTSHLLQIKKVVIHIGFTFLYVCTLLNISETVCHALCKFCTELELEFINLGQERRINKSNS